jgi:two-component sensor histidine kinase/ABC-type amino acid transport substrate-binding protein
MIKTFSIVLLLVFVFSHSILAQELEFTEVEKKWIKEHPIIYHGYDSTWHPFEFYSENDSLYYGIIGDYIKIVEERTGIEIKPIPSISWSEVIKKIKTQDLDLATGIIPSEDRKQYLSFTEPYLSYPLVIVTRKDFDFIGGLQDLQDRKISIPRDYTTTERIKLDFPTHNIIETEGIQQAIENVSYGNSDAFVGNLAVVSYYINKYGFTNLKIAAPTHYENINISFGIRKDWPELVSISNKIFSQISQEKHNEIKNHWIKVRYEYGVDVKQIIKTAGVVAGLILLIIIIIIRWNRNLKKEITKRIQIEKQLEESLLTLEKRNLEKKAMLREIHHRVKNNLQVVNSLLKLQSKKTENKEIIAMFNETRNRVISIALLHEKMYGADNIHQVDVQEYISLLVKDLVKNYAIDKQIDINIQIEPIKLMMRTLVPLGLIINEMITNSLKHGFKNRKYGEISVFIKPVNGNQYELIFGDNGWGINGESNSKGIGMSLIKTFTKQLRGSLEKLNTPGTVFKLIFENIDL